MENPAERPNRIPWPPLLYGGTALFALLLHWLMPLAWPEGTARLILAVLGLVLACAAVALDVSAALAFHRHHTTIMPHRAASALITRGPFALTRNPIYVANTMLVTGAGLFFGIAWLIAAAFAAALLTWRLAIAREERHLAARFGREWADYAARTPRWLFFR
ncbi:methyltransferase family protein [Aestuariivirga sp.]|uniref:methyltransferase family protein n=1 Tax=Aestuariivirga sp. TaxID=2650926 RepID=UPI00391DBE82